MLLWLGALPLMGSPGPATLGLAAIGAVYSGHSVIPDGYKAAVWSEP